MKRIILIAAMACLPCHGQTETMDIPAREAAVAKVKPEIEALARKHFGPSLNEFFMMSSRVSEETEPLVTIDCFLDGEVMPADAAKTIKRQVIAFTSAFQTKGFKANAIQYDFRVKVPDGMGNDTRKTLITLILRKDLAAKVNWASPKNIDARKAFTTLYTDLSFKPFWEQP